MDFLKNKWIWAIVSLLVLFGLGFGFYRSSRNRKEKQLLEQLDKLKEEEGIEYQGGTAEDWFKITMASKEAIEQAKQDLEVQQMEKNLLQRKLDIYEQQFNNRAPETKLKVLQDEPEAQKKEKGNPDANPQPEKLAYDLARKANTLAAWEAFLGQTFPTKNFRATAASQRKLLLNKQPQA